MKDSITFETSEQAEQAFYSAFQRSDIEKMMSIWCKDCETFCIHPGGPRLEGLDNIRKSWEQIFNYDRVLKFKINQKKVLIENNIALHHVIEAIYVNDELQSEIIATNIYLKTNDGWKMVLHHASPELHPNLTKEISEELDDIQTIH